jgi:hypothetical protein
MFNFIALSALVVNPIFDIQPKHVQVGQEVEFNGNNCFHQNHKSSYYLTSGKIKSYTPQYVELELKSKEVVKCNHPYELYIKNKATK